MSARYDVLIVGAGHGGAATAIGLRQRGFRGSIGLIGDEPEPPYERPPLSKEYLSGEKSFDRILIRPAGFWAERHVDLRLGSPVVAVDPVAQTVSLGDGAAIGYGRLVWAAGGIARRLTCRGGDLAGVHTIRTRADVDALASALPAAERVVVIGGGYIGLEAAAVLRRGGKAVTLVEAQRRVLARVAGTALSEFMAGEHRAHGVDLRLGSIVDGIEGTDRVTGVRLADGEVLPADIAIVGIGIVPATRPLIDAGAQGGDGVTVDDGCATSLPGVFAIGDGARHANAFADGAMLRLEFGAECGGSGGRRRGADRRRRCPIRGGALVLVPPI